MTHAILPFLIATILAAGTAGVEVRTIGGAASPCLADSVGRALATSRIEVLVLRRDSTQLAMHGLLPADTADVSIVTDSTTCEAGLAAYNAHASQTPLDSVSAVFVVRSGPTRYVVVSPANAPGEFKVYLVFDGQWHFVGSFLG